MTKIILCGCNGKMGQKITALASEDSEATIIAGVDTFSGISNTYSVYPSIDAVTEKADVIIDFSHPNALDNLIKYSVKNLIPIVICTTGHTEAQKVLIEEAKGKVAVFKSGNMSLGINLLMNLVAQSARTLEGLFDIEIVEKHHNKKIDAPSGTALMLADAMNEALEKKCDYVFERESTRERRTATEIGIHSVRGGTIVGEHSIIFAGNDEIIEIKHTALSRDVFAVGALRAAKFMKEKSNGLYSMKNIIEEEI